MNGYMNGARTELDPKIMIAARSTSRSTSGMSHHFFSRLRNTRNSLSKSHIAWRDITNQLRPAQKQIRCNSVRPQGCIRPKDWRPLNRV